MQTAEVKPAGEGATPASEPRGFVRIDRPKGGDAPGGSMERLRVMSTSQVETEERLGS